MSRLSIVALFTAVALVGCAFSDARTVVARSASTLVAMYCQAPETVRVLLRAQIASDTAPNTIRVGCAADAL
ncbi:hypothetical protein [Pseudomonas sp. C2B4]|uniref:hypothetical protein n=1 Tax=Pseudomonas sp. C2B4 TaxID=2735270 RepID=UPI001585D75C|nr:hypothetical protein [Pseudomonas sp. C2B4]NUU34670.1 hypothetical protein [Pseudomonas sp. C2B4]